MITPSSSFTNTSQGVITLLEHPQQLEDLKNDPSLAKNFAQEICRYHTASSFATRRVAKVDITLRGQVRQIPGLEIKSNKVQEIKAGEGLIASNQAANRDPEVFPNPDKFDIHRKIDPVKNLAYGVGDHRCIAEGLATTELETVFCKSPRA